jgi:hypothetical protein
MNIIILFGYTWRFRFYPLSLKDEGLNTERGKSETESVVDRKRSFAAWRFQNEEIKEQANVQQSTVPVPYTTLQYQ